MSDKELKKFLTMDIQDIKTRLSIETLLSRYNLEPGKHHKLCCPFHEEKTPSFTVYPKTNTFHCFGCGISGDTIEFIQLKENITKHEAILKAQDFIKDKIECNNCDRYEKKNALTKKQMEELLKAP